MTTAPPPHPTYPQSASDLLGSQTDHKVYWDRSHYDSHASQLEALGRSSTVYVGNLTFRTTTNQLHAFFSYAGRVKRVIMGVDRYKKSPCGFAFVEYCSRTSAENAVLALSSGRVDGRPVRIELDAGFKPGRQFGRGTSGGQVRDDRRGVIDPDRIRSDVRGSSTGGEVGDERPTSGGGGSGGGGIDGGGGEGVLAGGSKWTPPPARVRPTWEPPVRETAVVGEKRRRDDEDVAGEQGVYGGDDGSGQNPVTKAARLNEDND